MDFRQNINRIWIEFRRNLKNKTEFRIFDQIQQKIVQKSQADKIWTRFNIKLNNSDTFRNRQGRDCQ